MEFYTDILRLCGKRVEFQFPTGWNSTKHDGQIRYNDQLFQFPTGWNSTETLHYSVLSIRWVSIPNGMEFYARVRYLSRLSARFNSQRDGILLDDLDRYCKNLKFQFPTGWNSTL